MEYTVNNLNELAQIAKEIVEKYPQQRVFVVNGPMGAGKTTLIRMVCLQLQTIDNVASPTFSIVNEYDSPSGSIYHFDFYRLEVEAEALDMGCEEYFYSGNYCFIEWASKIPNLIPENSLVIEIDPLDDTSRIIKLKN